MCVHRGARGHACSLSHLGQGQVEQVSAEQDWKGDFWPWGSELFPKGLIERKTIRTSCKWQVGCRSTPNRHYFSAGY